MPLRDLPHAVWYHVFQYLGPHGVATCAEWDRAWRCAVQGRGRGDQGVDDGDGGAGLATTTTVLSVHAGSGHACAQHALDAVAQRAWHAFCRARWGAGVPDCHFTITAPGADGSARPQAVNWYEYYAFRTSTWRCDPSPWSLIQERYGHDPWSTIVCCVLCSRTSGSDTVHDAIARFMQVYPTPTDVMNADVASCQALLHPLGLHRERIVPRTAAGFLDPAWTHYPVDDLVGCGPFTRDSVAVFCHGGMARVARDAKADRTVRAYCTWWLKRHGGGVARPFSRGGAGHDSRDSGSGVGRGGDDVGPSVGTGTKRVRSAMTGGADGGARRCSVSEHASGRRGGSDHPGGGRCATASPAVMGTRRSRRLTGEGAASTGKPSCHGAQQPHVQRPRL